MARIDPKTSLFAAPTPGWQLAEVNIARLLAPVDDPRVAPFVNALDQVNAIADRMPGFVWRHTDATGNATDTRVGDDDRIIFNTSIWADVPSLERFVWGTLHLRFYERRAEWFSQMESMHFAMWWVPPGTTITPDQAMARLAHLAAHGPTERAFGWAEAPGAALWQKRQCAPVE